MSGIGTMSASAIQTTYSSWKSCQEMEKLRELIRTHPLIDNHAHNLLKQHHHPDSNYSFISITSEATGHALPFTTSTLSHFRAIKMMSEPALFNCDATLESVQTARIQFKSDELNKKCLQGAGIQCVLIDDGLYGEDVHDYKEHDRFTTSATKRIVRIEKVAEDLLREICPARKERYSETKIAEAVLQMLERFPEKISEVVRDPEVAGFKSVIAYRTGLNVSHKDEVAIIFGDMRSISENLHCDKLRLSNKDVNNKLVLDTCNALQQHRRCGGQAKPFQFHTGFGDNDLKLVDSDPVYLQPLIKDFPEVYFVLLHTSYPFTRQAAYLAAVYENVYLDIGEAFPQLAHHGQKAVLKQLLELAPTSKIMWSSDGHWWPETYWLAAKQFREVFEEIICKFLWKSHLTIPQAERMVKDIFFANANRLYNLNLLPAPLPFSSQERPTKATPFRLSILHSVPANPNHAALLSFLEVHPTVQYIRLQWIDYSNSLRCRVVPVEEMLNMTKSNSFASVAKACLSMLQNCVPVRPGFSPAGMWDIVPDWGSLRLYGTNGGRYAGVMCCFKERGTGASTDEAEGEVDICPRTALKKALKVARDIHHIKLVLGFELEVVFLERCKVPGSGSGSPVNAAFIESSEPFTYRPLASSTLTKGHSWSTTRSLHDPVATSLLEEIHRMLELGGVGIQMIHSEAAPGQYEIVMAPHEGIAAVDALYHARETIQMVAEKFGLRATLYPKPFEDQVGTGSHMHFSINPVGEEVDRDGEQAKELAYRFVYGILEQLVHIVAFSYSMDGSFERLKPGFWAGSRFVCWGDENREAPIRRVGKGYGSNSGRWEFRCMDGLANVYLVLWAVVNSGVAGVSELFAADESCVGALEGLRCDVDPESLFGETGSGRYNLLQSNFEHTLQTLEEGIDSGKAVVLGGGESQVLRKYIATKSTEIQFFKDLGTSEEVKRWVVERW